MPLSYKNDEQSDERLDPYNDLRHTEQQTGQNAGINAGIDQLQTHANNPANASTGINSASEAENNPAVPNKYDYNPSGGKQKVNGRIALAKKLGPAGIIILLFGGGAGILMTLLVPGIALVHIKEIVENKIDTQASVIQTRADKLMASRLLGGTNKAVSRGCTNGGIKVFCRYTKLGKAQIQILEESGITIRDGKGNVISSADLESGKVRPNTLELSDGSKVKASAYQRSVLTNAQFRDSMRNVFPSRFAAWNDKAAITISKVQNWVRNPKWTDSEDGGNSKTNSEQIKKNISDAETANGSIEEAVPEVNDYQDSVDKGVASEQSTTSDGNSEVSIPGDLGEALTADGVDTSGGIAKKIGKGALGVLNPTSVVLGMCSTYGYGRNLVSAAKTLGALEEIRFAFQFLSTADKIKAGDATPNDVSSAMNTLEKQNKFGDSFGDSTGYSYAQYGKITDTPVNASLGGSDVLSLISNSLTKINSVAGSPQVGLSLSDECSILSSREGQILTTAASLVLDLFGPGEALQASSSGAKATFKIIVEKLTEKLVDKETGELTGKSILKATSKSVVKNLSFIAGFMLAGKVISTFLTPYLVHLITGTLFTGDGVSAMDAIVSGSAIANNSVAQQRGMTALTPSQAMAFFNYNNSNTATYIADQEKSANPLDVNNPYSASNQLGFSLSSFFSNINVAQDPASILSLPSKVLSVLNPANNPNSNAYADSTTTDRQALMDECQDTDATQNGTVATDPFCNPIYGFDNVSMLENEDPGAVAQWMLSNGGGYIDDNGNPIGAYASYVQTCFSDQTANQSISSLLDNNNLPQECYKPIDIDQTTYDYWHLYQIDNSIADTMDNGFPTVASTSNGAPTTFTVASFNMCQEINHPANSGSACPLVNGADEVATKRQKEASTITGQNTVGNPQFDIVGAQEVSQPTQKVILNNDSNYESFPSVAHPYKDDRLDLKSVPSSNGKAIFWNTQKFGYTNGGFLYGVRGNGSSRSAEDDSFPWVQLTATTGQTVYIMSAHVPNDGFGNATDRIDDAKAILAWAETKATGNNLVIVTGDFNVSGKTDSGRPSGYCILTTGEILQHARDMAAGEDPSTPCPTNTGIPIDQIYASTNITGLTASGWQRVQDSTQNGHLVTASGSDHSPAWVTYTVPGSSGSNTSYTNPVYNGDSPDPSVIHGDDGIYNAYATGNVHLTSKDMVHWKKAGDWNITGGGQFNCMWAPDVAKVGSHYILTYAGIPDCSSVGAINATSEIRYAIGTSANGPFKYGGTITGNGYAIDPHLFTDDDGSIWLEYGGGDLFLVPMKLNGEKISIAGPTKTIYSRSGTGTIENGWIEKQDGWYYLFFSQGDYHNKGDNRNGEYSTKVARSKKITGPYTPSSRNYRTVLSGNGGEFYGPGGGSITIDSAGNQWFVYHAWYKGQRSLLIDPITYSNGWPVISNGHPSSAQQTGPVIGGSGVISI